MLMINWYSTILLKIRFINTIINLLKFNNYSTFGWTYLLSIKKVEIIDYNFIINVLVIDKKVFGQNKIVPIMVLSHTPSGVNIEPL